MTTLAQISPAPLEKRLPPHLLGMVIGLTAPGGVYVCFHYRQLSRCASCAPVADHAYRRLTETKRREQFGRE